MEVSANNDLTEKPKNWSMLENFQTVLCGSGNDLTVGKVN